jgi:hypothetical protein
VTERTEGTRPSIRSRRWLFDIEIREPSTEHAISIQQVERWLDDVTSRLNEAVKQARLKMMRCPRALTPTRRPLVGKTTGLHLSWFVYHGAGKVTFSPEQVKPWEDTRAAMNSPWAPLWNPPVIPKNGKVVVQATFAAAGTYGLKALADDGALLGSDGVTVTVTQ